jgi:hypothetical protein
MYKLHNILLRKKPHLRPIIYIAFLGPNIFLTNLFSNIYIWRSSLKEAEKVGFEVLTAVTIKSTPSGMWRRIVWKKSTDVSEVSTVSSFRVEE